MLCLSLAEVKSVIDLDRAIMIADGLYREQIAGDVVAFPPKQLVTSKATLRISGGALVASEGIGVRISVSGGAYAVALLFNVVTGEPLCLMGYPFSTLRTAGMMGLATRHLSRSDSKVLAMLGTGSNAPGYVRAACLLRPIEEVRVYSRDAANRERFAASLDDELSVAVSAVESRQAACDGADIVCISTSSPTPALDAEDLEKGMFVVSMGRPRELDPSVYLGADDIVVSYKPPTFPAGDEVGQLIELNERGEVPWDVGVHELGDVLVGRDPVTPGVDRLTVFRDVQGGFGDVALCLYAYESCVASGLGTEVDLS